MESVKVADVSNFVVTLEVAIAVISLVPLSVVFIFFGLAMLGHQGPEPFYPEEIKPVLVSSAIVCGSIYLLQIVQLTAGIMVLQSMSLIKVNLKGALRTSWVWLCFSIATVITLILVLYHTGNSSGSNRFLLGCLWAFLMQKSCSIFFVSLFITKGIQLLAIKGGGSALKT